jgi:hypothetical protein
VDVTIQDSKPIIAILTMDDESNHFRGNRENFIDIIRTGNDMGAFVFVTTVGDLQLDRKKILGYVYDPNDESWARRLLPLPHVVYNRIPFRKDELMPEVQEKIEHCLQHPHVKLFNPAFFNKWSLFEWLRKSSQTKKYIPNTRKLASHLDLSRLLRQHSFLYLKPARGKAGRGIMQVKRRLNKRLKYQLSIQESRKSQTYSYVGLTRIWNKIDSLIDSEEYIAQQGISLARINGRPFDLRVLVQKNSKGRWMLTGIGARVAGTLSITTHVPRGGYIDEPEKLLGTAFGVRQAKSLMRRTKSAAMSIAKQIEKGSGNVLGEMSLDLGIDTEGAIWFFEANAKPMKFDEPHIRQKSLESVVRYCMYLAKTKKGKQGGSKIAR